MKLGIFDSPNSSEQTLFKITATNRHIIIMKANANAPFFIKLLSSGFLYKPFEIKVFIL